MFQNLWALDEKANYKWVNVLFLIPKFLFKSKVTVILIEHMIWAGSLFLVFEVLTDAPLWLNSSLQVGTLQSSLVWALAFILLSQGFFLYKIISWRWEDGAHNTFKIRYTYMNAWYLSVKIKKHKYEQASCSKFEFPLEERSDEL